MPHCPVLVGCVPLYPIHPPLSPRKWSTVKTVSRSDHITVRLLRGRLLHIFTTCLTNPTNSLIGNTSSIMLGKSPRATSVALEIFFLSIGWILLVGESELESGSPRVRLPPPPFLSNPILCWMQKKSKIKSSLCYGHEFLRRTRRADRHLNHDTVTSPSLRSIHGRLGPVYQQHPMDILRRQWVLRVSQKPSSFPPNTRERERQRD